MFPWSWLKNSIQSGSDPTLCCALQWIHCLSPGGLVGTKALGKKPKPTWFSGLCISPLVVELVVFNKLVLPFNPWCRPIGDSPFSQEPCSVKNDQRPRTPTIVQVEVSWFSTFFCPFKEDAWTWVPKRQVEQGVRLLGAKSVARPQGLRAPRRCRASWALPRLSDLLIDNLVGKVCRMDTFCLFP